MDATDFQMETALTMVFSNLLTKDDVDDGKATKDHDDTMSDLDKTVDDLLDVGDKLADGATDLSDGIREADDAMPDLTDGTESLAEGVEKYTDGVDQVNSGASKLKDGIFLHLRRARGQEGRVAAGGRNRGAFLQFGQTEFRCVPAGKRRKDAESEHEDAAGRSG